MKVEKLVTLQNQVKGMTIYDTALPLEITYPPRAMTINMAKDPKVLATIIFRPKAPIRRKREIDI